MTGKERKYRPNVAAVVCDGKGHLLACHRSDIRGAWQIPQGGIEKDETAEEALYRELKEEIGTDDVDLVDRLPDAIRYDFPENIVKHGYNGQEQTYFLVRLRPTSVVSVGDKKEFDGFRWVRLEEFYSLISGFKEQAYRRALEAFAAKFPDLLPAE